MKVIKEIYHNDIGLDRSSEIIKYEVRKAARAVLVNESNQVALLHVTKDGYYKLPGGGVEENESIHDALAREVYEEAGTGIEILDELGMTIEYREQFEQLQMSYSFLCKTRGELIEPNYTQNELDHGFRLVWKGIDEAINAIETYRGEKYVAKFICFRDLHILRAAGTIMQLK